MCAVQLTVRRTIVVMVNEPPRFMDWKHRIHELMPWVLLQ